jgi:hypothetical protein
MRTRNPVVSFAPSSSGAAARLAARRKEPREAVVRLVEYTPFPRTRCSQPQRVGFTRNVSASGLCLRANSVRPVGSLLRVRLRGIDGRPESEAIGRVCWAEPTTDGACWLGVSLLARGSGPGPAAPPFSHSA